MPRALRLGVGLTLALATATCTDRNLAGPRYRGTLGLDLRALEAASGGNQGFSPVPVDSIRLQLAPLGAGGGALDTAVAVQPDSASGAATVTLTIPLEQSRETFSLQLTARGAGITWYAASNPSITVIAGAATQLDSLVAVYVGPGHGAASLSIGPRDTTAISGMPLLLTALVVDSADSVDQGVPVGFRLSDSTRGTVSYPTDLTPTLTPRTPLSVKDSVWLVGQTPTHVKDSTLVYIVLAATQLAMTTQPSGTAQNGVALAQQPVIQLENASGNPVGLSGVVVTAAIATGGGTLGGPLTATTNGSGVAGFTNLEITGGIGARTLSFSATALTPATSGTITVSAGAPSKLAFTVQPSTTQGTQAITPKVQVAVQDSSGNTVTSATNAIAVAIGANPSGDTLGGTTTVNAVNGVATFNTLTLDRPGSGYTLVATAAGLGGATSANFAIQLTFVRVSVGFLSTCGVTTAGAAYCWGTNIYGELGIGTLDSSTTPVAVSGGLTFAAVSALGKYGDSPFTCGVTTGGAAYCWGYNGVGELGNDSTSNSLTPVAVAGGLTFAAVSAGDYQTCGVTTAGAAYCWGDNPFGELGTGTTTNSPAPVAVAGGLTFAAVSSGSHYTCGVATGGAAYCWGYNAYGPLGDDSTTNSLTPMAVSGGLGFTTVSAGFRHTCGVTNGGAAYCWGDNSYGALGDDTTAASLTPVAVAGGLTFVAISAGNNYTCGVTTGGAAYCWGYNGDGELGNGTTTSSTTPVAVSGGLTFTAISAGDYHSCGVTTAGGAYCWGLGALGNGTQFSSDVPVRVLQ